MDLDKRIENLEALRDKRARLQQVCDEADRALVKLNDSIDELWSEDSRSGHIQDEIDRLKAQAYDYIKSAKYGPSKDVN